MPDADALAKTLLTLTARAGKDPVGALDYALERVRAAGLTDVVRVENDGRPAVVARRPGVTRPLVLSGHVDVVPVGDDWTVDPHAGAVKDGRVIARGTTDMLGAVACFIHLVEERPDLPLAVAFTTDEETGMQGADALVAEPAAFEDVAGIVVGEPTDFEVGVAEKGVLWVRLASRGRNAHASMPEKGENAAEKLMRAWQRVAAIPLESTHPLLGRPTRSLGTFRSGSAINVVPDRAEADVDFRYLPDTTPDALLGTLREAAAPDAEVDVLTSHPPFAGDPEGALARAAVAGVQAAGREAPVVGLPYGTEACRFVARAPCIILGPGERALAHTPDESIALDDLAAGYRAYEALAGAFSVEG